MAGKPIQFTECLQLSAVGIQLASNPSTYSTTCTGGENVLTTRNITDDTLWCAKVSLLQAAAPAFAKLPAGIACFISMIFLHNGSYKFSALRQSPRSSHISTTKMLFWKWISDTKIGFVTDTAVFHWTITHAASPLAKIFDRHEPLLALKL